MIVLVLFVVGLAGGVATERAWARARTPGAPGPTAPEPGRRRHLALRVVGALVLVGLGTVLAGYLYAEHRFSRVDTVPVGDELAGAGAGTNYLLVGTDSRPGLAGNRSDTLLVLRTTASASRLVSIPRDLWVEIPGREGRHRINAAYSGPASGPATLVRTVQQSVGIPVDRYVEINFTSFAGVVDALGGVTIDFAHPASDPKSGLSVQESGPVELSGDQALAYVRSRTYTEVIDGEEVVDPTGDLGRVQRQQKFLRAVLSRASSTRNPLVMHRISGALIDGLAVDDAMTLFDALRFAWRMGRLEPETVVLPTEPTTRGEAAVLLLRQPEADGVIGRFRG